MRRPRSVLLVDSVVLEAFKAAGGPTALARAIGIHLGSVHRWRRISPIYAVAVEKVTGIPRTRLRPDIYPTEGVPPPPIVWVPRVRARPPGAAGNKYAGSYPRRKAAAARAAAASSSSSS